MSVTETDPLTEARQRAAAATAYVAHLRSQASAAATVSGAALAAALAEVELAQLPLAGLEQEATAQAEQAQVAGLQAAVDLFVLEEAKAIEAWRAARRARYVAEAAEMGARDRHSALVGRLIYASQGAPAHGGPVRPTIPGAPPQILISGEGYRSVRLLTDPLYVAELEGRMP